MPISVVPIPVSAGTLSDGDKGDVTVSASGATFTVDNDVVTYAKMQNVSAASKLLGRGDSGSGDVQEITLGSGLTMTGTTLSSSGGGGGAPTDADYLVKTANGSLSAERVVGDSTTVTANWGTAGAVSFERAALSGDVTASANSNTTAIASNAVTFAKFQTISTDRLLGRSTSGTGNVEEITCTAAGRALLDDADNAAQRTTLGLGTLATQSGTFSGTSSGTNTGDQTITLTGDVTGSGTGSFAATIASNAVTFAKFQTISTDKLLGRSTAGTGNVEEITCTTAGRAILDDADASAQRTTLGLAIGTNVQAYDPGLASIAGLTTVADRTIYTTASDTYAVTTLTSFGRSLIDDADASAGRSTLGLGTIATQAASSVSITGGTLSAVKITDYTEPKTAPTISSGTLTLNLNDAQVFDVSLNANITTLTISNVDSSSNTVNAFTLIFTMDGTARTVTWPAAVKWPGGTGPTLTSTNGKKDVLSFLSPDNGTTWFGFVGGQNF